MEQTAGYAPEWTLLIGIGIGVIIVLIFQCALPHGDPDSALKCLVHLVVSFLFMAKAEGRNPFASFFPSSSSSSSVCNCKKPVIPEPVVVKVPGSRLDNQDREMLSWQEVRMVMQRLGIFSINPEHHEEMLGAQEIERVFEEQEPSLGEVKEAFDVFDKNRDGFIDAVELRNVLWALGLREVSEVDCRKLIRAFDENRDGLIDFREFTKLAEKSFCASHN